LFRCLLYAPAIISIALKYPVIYIIRVINNPAIRQRIIWSYLSQWLVWYSFRFVLFQLDKYSLPFLGTMTSI